MEVRECGFYAPDAGEGWLSYMGLENISSAAIAMISLTAVSKRVGQTGLWKRPGKLGRGWVEIAICRTFFHANLRVYIGRHTGGCAKNQNGLRALHG